MRPASLLGVFVFSRVLVLGRGFVPISAWTPLAFLWQDVLFVLLYAVVDRGLTRWPVPAWLLYALLAGYVAVNVPVACELATPLTWPLLQAARGTLADSVRHHITASNLMRLGSLAALAFGLPFLIRKYRTWLTGRRLLGTLAGLLLVAALGPWAAARVDTLGLHRNVFVTLLATAFPRVAARDVAGDWRLSPFGSREGEDLSRLRESAAGKNVVIVHLESTAARYLRTYGAAEDPMPTLTRLARHGLVFENAVTPFPETIKSFVAVHRGIQPGIDIPAERYGGLSTPSLARLLGSEGYRTGLFHSGRFGYLSMDVVVRDCRFQTAEDAGDIGGVHDSSFGIDEESTIRRLLAWVDEKPGGRFLATYLPIAGHHPYATPDGGGPFPDEPEINRYRNALAYADRSVGLLLDGLRKRGLEDGTLIVLLGDHGQAFGQHPGNFGHTLFLYEENVRVPLVFAMPGLTQGGIRTNRLASLVDVTPTLLDLIGLPVPARLDGCSLLKGPERVALFCTDYGLGTLGLRDGDWKLIHELETGRSRLYDLARDPDERYDLSNEYSRRVETYRQHLLSWSASARYQLR